MNKSIGYRKRPRRFPRVGMKVRVSTVGPAYVARVTPSGKTIWITLLHWSRNTYKATLRKEGNYRLSGPHGAYVVFRSVGGVNHGSHY